MLETDANDLNNAFVCRHIIILKVGTFGEHAFLFIMLDVFVTAANAEICRLAAIEAIR